MDIRYLYLQRHDLWEEECNGEIIIYVDLIIEYKHLHCYRTPIESVPSEFLGCFI